MAGRFEVTVLIFTSLFLHFSLSQEAEVTCGECDKSTCPSVEGCPSGVVADPCGCCDVCARGLGELCDPPAAPHRFGSCGEYLTCAGRSDLRNSQETTCQCQERTPVCGTNKVTYSTLCDLLAQVTHNPGLEVAVRGPCLAAPLIRSRPEDKERPPGSILVLDCEALGHPTPSITWRLTTIDGTSTELPGDNPAFAVQVRGGPESNMITGWVQIMRISQSTIGVYSCVATNSEGQAQASATVSLLKKDDNDHTNAV
uniref:Insulin-like androgenic gland binding protein n=1 Tax=Portunus trituberculatus TaxID=210409 RepID=A0A7D0AL55_PORTR|nr:insulin-like androgenic gland binding protein [Portunus trituberculatus]